jgi:branched-chain amino acid transport system substrate-binding protein
VPNVAHENTPIFFNTAYSSRSGLMWSHLLPIRLFHPEVKDIGVLYCGESEICKALNEELTTIAPQFGYRIVSRSQVSVAQPDYTAEVLAARSAGAKALVLFIDNYSAIRIATSAHRQGYDPYFGIQGSAASEKFLRDGGKDVEGFLIGGSALHWTSPLLTDFVAAYHAYVPDGIGLSSFAASSWNSGKLLEKVAPTWPPNPTTADVVASLLALKGETLGGLIAPTTFHPGQKAGNQCATILRVENGQFVPYQGRNEYHCAPGYRPG